jgi:ankyrin repeat protein
LTTSWKWLLTLASLVMPTKDLVEWLLQHGADPNITAKRGISPLETASRYYFLEDSKESMDLLIKYGAKATANTLINAMLNDWRNDIPAMKYHIDNGADINGSHEGFGTPLRLAVEMGKLTQVELLLESGVDTALRFKDQTPADLAKFLGRGEILELLLTWDQKVTRRIEGEQQFEDIGAVSL